MTSKYRLESGKLDEILRLRGLVRKNIQSDPDHNFKYSEKGIKLLDRKTVISINKGTEHTLGTFEKLASLLQMPIEELIPELAPTPKVISFLEIPIEGSERISASKISAHDFKWQFRSAKPLYKLAVENMTQNKMELIQELVSLFDKYQAGVAMPSMNSLSEQLDEYSQNSELQQLIARLAGENLGIYTANWELWEESDDFYNMPHKIFNSTECLLIAVTDIHPLIKFDAPFGDVMELPNMEYLQKHKKKIFDKYHGVSINGTFYRESDLVDDKESNSADLPF